jgi:hypothetical protein
VPKAAHSEAGGREIIGDISGLEEIQHVELLAPTVTAVAPSEEDRVAAERSGDAILGRLGADRPILAFEERPADSSRRTATRTCDVEQEHTAGPKSGVHLVKERSDSRARRARVERVPEHLSDGFTATHSGKSTSRNDARLNRTRGAFRRAILSISAD